MHLEIPYSFNKIYDREKFILKLLWSVHSLKQSNYNFCKKLCKALEERNILPCSTINYIFILKNLILIICIDDILIFSKKKVCINLFIKLLFKGVLLKIMRNDLIPKQELKKVLIQLWLMNLATAEIELMQKKMNIISLIPNLI